jgi:uncharacterized protein YjaG (DUF416 family)
MNFDEYREIIEKEVCTLDHKERVALCLICCGRLAPLYSKFVAVEGWGDETVLSQCRQAANSWLCGVSSNIGALAKQLSKVIPDTEDFGSALGSYALNSGVAHAHLLEQIKSKEYTPLIYVLQNCYDTIDFYVQELLDPQCNGGVLESDIEGHLAMGSEISWQLSMLNQVKGNQDLVNFVGGQGIEPIFNIV